MKLNLFFTEGVSLQTWNDVGMLDRELAIYKALQKRDVEVGFVTYGDNRDLQFASRLPGISLHVNNAQLPSWLYKRALQSVPPKGDVFKSNQVPGAQVAMAAARRAKAKFIARCGYWLADFNERRYGFDSVLARKARALENSIFTGADVAVVTTKRIKEAIEQRYKLPSQKVKVIPNYVETDVFRPQKNKPGQKPRLIFVGRLAEEKNLFSLFDAIAPMDLELLVIGEGPQRKGLEIRTGKMKAKTIFLGNLPNYELPAILNSCDLFVLPSLHEGQPKTLQEAMSCGLPVVGADVPGITDLIQDGENGLLCKTDAASIRFVIERLISDHGLRERLGIAARSFVEKEFALGHVAELEMNLLNDLVAQS